MTKKRLVMVNGAKNQSQFEKTVIVTRKTELEELIDRFNTPAQAKFYLEHAGQAFEPIEAAHNLYHDALNSIREDIPQRVKQQVIERSFLPQFMFDENDLVVTVGIDGLVVNTAKYLTVQPIIAVNPDPNTIDGILLPFDKTSFKAAIENALSNAGSIKKVTMAQASLNDGQEIIAFNDIFIGPKSHVSARYKISHNGMVEEHSSSGIIISTGAGSTGWLQSIYAGASGVISALGGQVVPPPNGGSFDWDDNYLIYAVREPFPSKASQASLVYGVITQDSPLELTSHMAEYGVIFSDGVEKDYLDFNAGTTARIEIAKQKAKLIVH